MRKLKIKSCTGETFLFERNKYGVFLTGQGESSNIPDPVEHITVDKLKKLIEHEAFGKGKVRKDKLVRWLSETEGGLDDRYKKK